MFLFGVPPQIKKYLCHAKDHYQPQVETGPTEIQKK